MDRRDGDASVDDRMEVRALHGQPRRRRPADPEVGDAARIEPDDQLVLVDALAEAGDLEPFALLRRDAGHVDVDQLPGRQPVLEDVPRDGGRGQTGQREVGMLVVLLRDRERRAAVDDRLHGRADRPRVGDVVAEVRPVVDARRDEVEGVPEIAEERQADRIGRGAVDRVRDRTVGQRPLADAQGPHERLLMADRALVRVGRDDRDVADGIERHLERQEAARLHAVVVGDEDARPAGPLTERPGAGSQRPATATDGPAGQRLAALLVEVASLCPGALAGHVRRVVAHARSVVAHRRIGLGVVHVRVDVGFRPGSGSRGMRTLRPSRSDSRRAARPVTLRSADERRR